MLGTARCIQDDLGVVLTVDLTSLLKTFYDIESLLLSS